MLFYCNSEQTAGSHCQCWLFQHLLQLRLMLSLLDRHLWKQMWFPALEWSSRLISEGYVFSSACIILTVWYFFFHVAVDLKYEQVKKNLLSFLKFFSLNTGFRISRCISHAKDSQANRPQREVLSFQPQKSKSLRWWRWELTLVRNALISLNQPLTSLYVSYTVHSQPVSGQGSPCGLDQVPSPQSLISSSSSSTPSVKNEQNQVCVQNNNN